jgi:plastocyanin
MIMQPAAYRPRSPFLKPHQKLLLAGALALAAILAGRLSARGITTNVNVVGTFPNYSYNPKVLSIQAGDTVIWTNLSTIHSVTSDTPPETLCGTTPVPGGKCTNTFLAAGTYFYHCVNHGASGMTGVVNVAAVAVPPTLAITNPVGGSVFAAPASVKIFAAVTNTSGTVTNVEFFGNAGSLGAITTPPYNLTTTPLGAGAYSLTAKATATSGLSGTSAPVNISVVTPVTISNYSPRVVGGQFVFDHTANPGLRYVAERSATLTNWSPFATNTAVSNSVEVQDIFQVGTLRFYRVGRVPNP